MSFLSVADIKLAVELAFFLHEKCFTRAERADLKYHRFGREIKSLGVTLNKLYQVAESAQRDHTGGLHDDNYFRAQLQPLSDVIGDFRETLKECKELLINKKRFKRDTDNFINNVIWHTTVERDVLVLTDRLQFHLNKAIFIIKPLEIHLLLGIRHEVRTLQEEIRKLAAAIHNNPSGYSIAIPALIAARFQDAILKDPPEAVQDITHLPLKEGFDALVYCFTKSTIEFNPGIDPSRRTPEEIQFVNLLKARWLLDKLKASSHLADAGPDSLWMIYEKQIELKIVNEYRRFESNSLIPPPTDDISRLPDDCFLIWIAQAPTIRPPDLAEQRPLENLILEVAIASPVADRRSVLTIFRSSDVDFRMVTATTWTDEQNRLVERESFPINMTTTRLIPAYAVPNQPARRQTNNFLLYPTQDPLWIDLECQEDVPLFQQALTGYHICHDVVDVTWSFNGSEKSEKSGNGKLQLWQVSRLLPKVAQTGNFAPSAAAEASSTPPPRSPDSQGERPMSGKGPLTPKSTSIVDSTATCLSSGSLTSRLTGSRDNGTVIFPPDPPVLIMFTMLDGRYIIQHFELHEIAIDPEKCKCERSPLKCRRAVLRTSAKAINVRRLTARDQHEQGLHSWDLSPFRLPRHPKYRELDIVPKVKYICLDFPQVKDRELFCAEFAALKNLRRWELEWYQQALRQLQERSGSIGRLGP